MIFFKCYLECGCKEDKAKEIMGYGFRDTENIKRWAEMATKESALNEIIEQYGEYFE